MLIVNYRSVSETYTGFSETVFKLLNALPDKEKVLTINLFGHVSEVDYLFNLEIIRQTTQRIFGRSPLLNYIAQSPENENTLIAEVGYLSEAISTSAVHYYDSSAGRYLIIETEEFGALLVEGIMSDNIYTPIGEQSSAVFSKIQQILHAASMPVESIIRQWNYIGHITAVENNRQHYQEFNNERARFYNQTTWNNGFPAATGISMDIDAVLVSLIAIQFQDKIRVYPLDNPLQLAAHRYSESVLGKSEQKQTPKFERAKLLVSDQSAMCFISGTAAILGEKSVENSHVRNQTLQTISLINYLISIENRKENGIEFVDGLKLKHLRVYVKNADDLQEVRKVVESELPGVNAFYVCAPVCREELLVEIEGIAVTES